MCNLYRYGSFWLIKPKACTNQKVVRDTSCLTEIKASRSAFLDLVAKSAKSAKYRVFCGYMENPGYTRVIPALLHGFAPGTTPTAATTTENPAYHFRIPLYHTTPKLIKISPNTGLIPVKFLHWTAFFAVLGGFCTTDFLQLVV